MIERLPIVTALVDHEPWSGHKVDTLESYARPEMMEPGPINGTAHLGRL